MEKGCKLVGGLKETEAQRLQREADGYTGAVEHEKKAEMIIQDQYKQTKE